MDTEQNRDDCIDLIDLITQLNLHVVSHEEDTISQYKSPPSKEAEDVCGSIAVDTHIQQLNEISTTVLSLIDNIHDICWVLQQQTTQTDALQVHSSYFTSVRTLLNGITCTVNKWQDLLNTMNAKALKHHEDCAVKQLATCESVMRAQSLYLDRAHNSVLLVKRKLTKLLELRNPENATFSMTSSTTGPSSSLVLGALSTSSFDQSHGAFI